MRVGNLRLLIVVAGLALAWLSWQRKMMSPFWPLLPVAIFVALAIFHEQVIRAKTRAERLAAFYRRGLARIEDRWAGTGDPGDRFRDAKHVYSEDLDLFGRGGLFEMLSTARLPMGEDWLARWLLAPSPVAIAKERQELIAELRAKLALREELAVIGEDLRARLLPEPLATWAEKKPLLPKSAVRAAAAVLALSAVATIVFGLITSVYLPFFAVLVVEALFLLWLKRRAVAVITDVGCNAEGLVLFAEVLKQIQAQSFTPDRLRQLQEKLKKGDEPASRSIERLTRVVYWIDARSSQLARLAELPLLYTVQVAFAVEAWRRRWGSQMRVWLDVMGEMEALLSLASYAFEHPDDPFPVFEEGQATQTFLDGEELGHPLIPSSRCVRNTVRLDPNTRVLLVSGSNMSGKSTLLRTVGINLVLARAGAPIRGKRLRLSPLVLGTRIRSTDSLQEGRSGFYTEILRIREVFDLTEGKTPLLFAGRASGRNQFG